ncbi:hypothetical protein BC941DRAFT_456568 [Chlamydoabsidia padenii]|nr:hypothetical protein BC941DRAFT_456568 [Chlamydoabsidia padenii]
MMLAQGSFLRSVRFGHDDVVGLKYLLETEYRFTKFYQDLPPDYRMDSRLFEPGLSEKTFRQRLDSLWNGNDSRMAALNLTLQYYQGIISFYESFLPDLRERQWAQVVGLLTDDGDTPSLDRSTTMASFTTPLIEDEATATWTIHQHHAQKKCTEAATFIVRLLDYQRTLPTYCSVNMQILLTAWDIHMRNACLGLTVTDNKRRYFDCLSSDTIHQARRSLLQCLSILHEGYLFNFAEHAIWKYYEHVERQLLDSLLVTPTAAYWIPFGL